MKQLLYSKMNPDLLEDSEKSDISIILSLDEGLEKIYYLQNQLYTIFYKSRGQDLYQAVISWCKAAKESGSESASMFANWLECEFLEEAIDRHG